MEGPTLEVRNVWICNWRWHQCVACVQDVCSVQSNPPGRRVVRSDLGGITRGKKVAVYWRWPKATGNIQGEWHEATVKSSNRRGLGTMTVEYDDGGSQDKVNINGEGIVWMENARDDAVLNIEERSRRASAVRCDKRTRTAADGEKHDATLAMDLDGTRHPLKEPLSGQLRV